MTRPSSVTDAIKEQIDIVEYAKLLGLEPVRHGSQGKYRSKVHDSLVLDPKAGAFSWNSQGIGGSVIDLAMEFKGLSQNAAISELRLLMTNNPSNEHLYRPPTHNKEPPKKAEFVMPEKSPNGFKRVFAYLTKSRHIDAQIVQEMVSSKYIYQDERNNACFCGYDYDNEVKNISFRGTLTDKPFRGEVPGGQKEIGFSYNLVNTPAQKLFIVEAPIDALSIMSMLKNLGHDYKEYSYLALGGTWEGAMLYHLDKHPELSTIYLAQDNDDAGHKSRARCRQLLEQKGFGGRIVNKPPVSKDFNDDLAKQKQQVPEHTKKPIQERTTQHVQVYEP